MSLCCLQLSRCQKVSADDHFLFYRCFTHHSDFFGVFVERWPRSAAQEQVFDEPQDQSKGLRNTQHRLHKEERSANSKLCVRRLHAGKTKTLQVIEPPSLDPSLHAGFSLDGASGASGRCACDSIRPPRAGYVHCSSHRLDLVF